MYSKTSRQIIKMNSFVHGSQLMSLFSFLCNQISLNLPSFDRYMLTRLTLSLIFLSLIHASDLSFKQAVYMTPHLHQPQQLSVPLTVHLIPHSHDDVGFVKTVDDYYYRGEMATQVAGVQYTFDTLMTQMTEHSHYKFSVVEMAFLWRWWRKASDLQKSQMKALVANGQIEFLNAGWCMSDEATMYYDDFMDQMTVGLRWLKENFNYVPDVAWHIDPFGHHSAAASLFSQMGFNSFFLARIDYQDKEHRLNTKSMEMIWRPKTIPESSNNHIFAHVNHFLYSPPPGYCFDLVCRRKDEPIKDDPFLVDYNLDKKADGFVDYFKSMSNHYRTNNLLHCMGGDFHYADARVTFKNMDKLIEYINNEPKYGVTFRYSTPSDYIKAIRQEQATYPVKTDDFFPYADQPHAVWSGFYTSRVALKGLVKDISRYLNTARKHLAEVRMTGRSPYVIENPTGMETGIFTMEMGHGILQHHDGVTGTSRQKVANDYVNTTTAYLHGFNLGYSQVKKDEILNEIGEKVSTEEMHINVFWNQSAAQTGVAEWLNNGKYVLVGLYNPGPEGSYPIRIRTVPIQVDIVDMLNRTLPGDIICSNTKNSSDCELLFNLEIKESSNSYVKLVPRSGGSAKIVSVKELTTVEQIKEIPLSLNDKIKFTKGNQSFELTLNGQLHRFKADYNYYQGQDTGEQNSGAYVFKPKFDISTPYSVMSKFYYAEGSTHGMIILESNRTLSRFYFSKTQQYVRKYGLIVETDIFPIDISDGVGKEITLNINTDIVNGRTFYTDSMGLEEQQRVLDYRPAWNYTVFQKTAGNFYPVNSFLRIRDTNNGKSVVVMNDRSQGGTVLREGEIELMIHRRLLADDDRGVGEALNQTQSGGQGIRQLVRHYVLFGSQFDHRALQKRNDQRILPIFVPSSVGGFLKNSIAIPPIKVDSQVKMTMRPLPTTNTSSYHLRLHNIDEKKYARVELSTQWKIQEHTLALNQLKSDWQKKQMNWKEEGQQESVTQARIMQETNIKMNLSSEPNTIVDLKPFEIKAFVIHK